MILPGGIIGGAPVLPASWVGVRHDSLPDDSTHTIASVDFGDKVAGKNEKWAIVMAYYFNVGVVTVTSPTIGGVAATVIYQSRMNVSGGASIEFVVWTAKINLVETGDVVWSDNRSIGPVTSIAYAINLDLSTISDSDSNDAGGSAPLSIDCPAGGGIWGTGTSSGGASTSQFANLTTLLGGVSRATAADVFASAQTALDVTFDPTPNPSWTAAIALSFPYAL
jgi:hypothetical protein